MTKKIGFMQGRLSPVIDNKIQAFPWQNWENEFLSAYMIGLNMMEWTLDYENLYQNPIMTSEGKIKIKNLCKAYNFSIPSLTADCFMQFPFWKTEGRLKEELIADFKNVCRACIDNNIKLIVLPLVDNGAIENEKQKNSLINFFNSNYNFFEDNNLIITFESDFDPARLYEFLSEFNSDNFGINYDIGNSASLGYDPQFEISIYGNKIYNVHVKDRVLNGATVPLGEGNADFDKIFILLNENNYSGNYILQTARSNDGLHSLVLNNYKNMLKNWIANSQYGS